MGAISLNGTRIGDHKPFGLLTFREVIAKSSNVGAIKTGLLVGSELFYRQIRSFGFGMPTGIDLPGEAPGLLRPLDRWQELDPAYISFGQGISVTALQLANLFAAVANGGDLLRPYVVARIGQQGTIEEVHPRPSLIGRPISAATARTISRMLEAVVTDGTGGQAVIAGYRVAGKTGTAQKAEPGRGYAANRHLASFVGYAPARQPAVVILVAIDEPRGEYHGGAVAAPVFARIARQVLLYRGIHPENEAPHRWPGERLARSIDGVTGGGVPRALPRTAATTHAPDSEVARAAGRVPDFAGLSARQAVVRSATLGLAIGLHGQGFVARQSPPAGTPIRSVAERIEVWLARP